MIKYAAIDLGTNTFHLLIASFDDRGNLVEHFRDRQYIHLAEDGIETIGVKAFQRALECVKTFCKYLERYDIRKVNCTGTAALRTASNGPELVAKIKEHTCIDVNIIDGIKEARYIYEGVKLAVPQTRSGNHIIMDIGGGSVEFIIIKNGHFHWSNSFPIGIAVLKRLFHKNDPITENEISSINNFIDEHVQKLYHVVKNLKVHSLIGASGSFEVLSGMKSVGYSDHLSVDIPVEFFTQVYNGLIHSTLQDRLLREDIPNDRAHLIIVAFHLMKHILDKINFQKITVSAYAMKEGILSEMREE